MVAARDFGRMRVDVGQPHVDLGDAVRVGRRLCLGQQRGALDVGLEHDLDQRLLGARRFLRHLADARVLRQADRAGLGREIAGDGLEQRRLAGAVAADEAGLGAGRQRQRGMVEKQASGNAERKVVDDQHGRRFCTRWRAVRKGRSDGLVRPDTKRPAEAGRLLPSRGLPRGASRLSRPQRCDSSRQSSRSSRS